MEVMLRNRSRLMLALSLAAFLLLVYAYAQLEWRLPQGQGTALALESRGSILAADGTVLAKTVGGKRVYPQGALAGQLLGMMGTDRGLEGVEAVYEDRLSRGENVTLTIDPRFQAVAESVLASKVREHEGEYGSVVALDVNTGRVLAVASYPPFDPGDWRAYTPDQRRNRPFTDGFEPGSTVKALVVAAALNDGVTTLNTAYPTPMSRLIQYKVGAHKFASRPIHDAVARPPGVNSLTVKGILRYSSNVGMSHVVEHFAPEKLHDYLARYGFGQKVDLPAVAAAPGLLSDWHRWDDMVRVNNSFGQGLSSSVLQLAAAYNTLANDGTYVSPQLVLEEPRGAEREVLRPATARTVRALLRAVVEDGIPHAAGIPGYDLGGKTGTAQVFENGHYSNSLYDSVFAGLFPSRSPRVTLAVMVHGAKLAYHGSMLAAPIFRDIAAEVYSQWAYPPAPPKEAAKLVSKP